MKSIIELAVPKFNLIKELLEHPILLIPTIPIVATTAIVVNFKTMCFVLGLFIIFDTITGLLASYSVWRKKLDKKDRWFFGNGEGFNSEKAKKLAVKLMVYLSVPLLLIHLQKTLYLKNFKYASISDAEFELATISLIVFCLIEGFSIFHENLPKLGFNLWKKIKEMIGFYKELKNEIND